MKKLLTLLVSCWIGLAVGQTPTVTNPTFYDDTYVHVPLQFGFPFYGRVFTNSWMHSNGIVSFLDPMAPIPNAPYNPAQWAYCCEGINLTPNNTQLGPQFNYMIAPLWTDLYPVSVSSFRTEGTTTYQKYFWNNIAEISNMNNLNTFSLEIRPTGFIGATYNQINIQNQNVTAGITGDIALGQMQQFYYGRGANSNVLSNWSVNSTGDICVSNPLSSPSCPGYTEAMCSVNPLYSSTCSGYQQAFLTQQCSANPLYSPNCPGYASAYFNYQCSLDPLYATQCPGYDEAMAAKKATTVDTSTTTSVSPAQSTTATVPLVQTQPTTVVTTITAPTTTEEKKDVSSSSVSSSTTSQTTQTDSNGKTEQPKTTRQEIQERRMQAAKRDAVEKGKNLANDMGKSTDMESQKQVQNIVIQAMGFTPGFDAYGKVFIPDGNNYKPYVVYANQKTVDNKKLGMGLYGPSDKLHDELTQSQYK